MKDRLSPPIEIQRPKSALHAGDFTEELHNRTRSPPDYPTSATRELISTSPTTPWYTHSPSLRRFEAGPRPILLEKSTNTPFQRQMRNRAPSLNLSSSNYVLKAPTTPLVQQSNNTDLDFSPIDLSTSPTRINRRNTLPPQSLNSLQSSPNGISLHDIHHLSSYRRELASPYQRHFSRRSLTSNWSLQPSTSPHSPASRPRRPSYSETSPLQNASMVGSFEESILRGSMSTAPSKPLDFTAQIGVLGKGNCKPKCPPHVTIPFPAVFYSWGGGVGRNQNIMDDGPSPYVGHIDLLNSLPNTERHKSRERQVELLDESYDSANGNLPREIDGMARNLAIRSSKKRRRTPPPNVPPPGGSYRIPQQGQLQIIIKNPNKTAVKLFLVPYDLTGMEAGTKTFIRQRCYSAESLDDGLSTLKPLDLPDISNKSQGARKKATLRYLIHLNICSLSKGRYYLYQHIRVVFANRVPDNKEQLQNEIQIPQPRYSTYKPSWDSASGPSSVAGARLTAEKQYRRRSSGFDSDRYPSRPYAGGSSFSFVASTPTPPIPRIPFNPAICKHQETAGPTGDQSEKMDMDMAFPILSSDIQSPVSDQSQLKSTILSSSYKSMSSNGSEGYEKLSPGDLGYGGLFGRSRTPEVGEGLLARKLRGLGVRRDGDIWGEDYEDRR